MSERILKALMQLFAIVAEVDEVTNLSRGIVQLFLKQQLNSEMVEEYLKIYDEFLEAHHNTSKKKDSKRKRTSVNSVKVLRICTQINAELTQKQKSVVLIRLLEYVSGDGEVTEQEYEFVETVSDSFNISRAEFTACLAFICCEEASIPDSTDILLVNSLESLADTKESRHVRSETLEGQIVVLNVDSVNMYLLRYFGDQELYLNGQILVPEQTYILTQGSSIRSPKVLPVYYSDIISRFLADDDASQIMFTADNIEYEFKGGKKGLHNLRICEDSGKLLGVMGGSGAGKSTLLNVLNGMNPPSKGQVLINGIDIHHEKDQIEGVIGHVSQDDLLIAELTVFQNLFYNAKLCYDGFNDKQITKTVLKLLNSIGLYETRNLRVGNPMMKTISGGQRKRLNIALELIREPSVLFVDEPTSGLSSRDSENIMDLLKELALKGKIIFVVIHQPSSEIYKMFDKLLILDVGGYPIYYGNPVDAVIYFKQIVKHVNAEESECVECGNVNPEQIFNIIESKVLDEYGNQTGHRKISSKEWNTHYLEKLDPAQQVRAPKDDVPKSTFNIPNKINQFKVFVVRDVLSKLTNTQYMMINTFEAPALALLLAYLVKFYNMDISNEIGYIFRENENLVAYMFMSVIVALFIGMTVSAEEIIRDQMIRKREAFLNLSNGSYLASKILIMFTISAIQTLSFILLGNWVLGIQGMFVSYWIVLFSTSCFANMLGLNISASFNSAVTIYICIPFLLIPQLLLSGVIVKFEKLNPSITNQTCVPWIGETMASRWAFEALAVNQFKNNKFESSFYALDKEMSVTDFKKNYWISEIKSKVSLLETNINKEGQDDKIEHALTTLRNEISEQMRTVPSVPFADIDQLTKDKIDAKTIKNLKNYVSKIHTYFIKRYNAASDKKDSMIASRQKGDGQRDAYNTEKNDYENESLNDLLRNKTEFNKIQEIDDHFLQRIDPVFLDPISSRAHFYAPRKLFFGKYYDTLSYNICMLWAMSFFLIITLYFDVFPSLLNMGEIIRKRFGKN